MTTLQSCRANGGFLIHLKEKDSMTALCGHTPANTSFRMKARGGWLVHTGSRKADCKKCVAKLEQQTAAKGNVE